ncbi:3-oxoacyl-[acyl-carrier-protein] synthase 3 [Alphaproteobacteria bacterium SO-S41]|nr:3-oxoacyl-[acyl-carrier-protein] synthase 3 [Alphaproteobacteria bacterium SO-S41]
MSVRRSVVAGTGAYLPEKIVTNADLAKIVDTSDEWVLERTGIAERRMVADGETTSDLAVKAAEAAMAAAGVTGEDIDLIVLATTTPDYTFPATATQVQHRIGMTRGAAFDVQAVCSGFIYALNVADNFIKVGQANTVLVIGAETMSRLLDWTDRTTCVLFGDGAGALVLKAGEGDGTSADRGVLSSHLYSDGRLRELLYVDGGPSTTQSTGHLRMQGKEVFKHAVTNISGAITAALDANNLKPDDVAWFVPHQANKRILDATARKIGLKPESVVMTVAKHGNTSAASIPLALHEAVADGRVKRNDLVLLEAMGGGFTWGSSLIRW